MVTYLKENYKKMMSLKPLTQRLIHIAWSLSVIVFLSGCRPITQGFDEIVIPDGYAPVAWRPDSSEVLIYLHRQSYLITRELFAVALDHTYDSPKLTEWTAERVDSVCQSLSFDGTSMLIRTLGPDYDAEKNVLQYNLYKVSARDYEKTFLLTGEFWSCPSWSPDGQSFAIIVNSSHESHRLQIYGIDGSFQRELYSVSGSSDLYTSLDFPVWSPDGETIAFIERDNDVDKLAIISVDGGEPQYIQPAYHTITISGQMIPLGASEPSWSPDSQRLVYIEGPDMLGGGPGRLVVLTLSDLSKTYPKMEDDQNWYGSPVWSPDGAYIAVSRIAKMTDVRHSANYQVVLIRVDELFK